MMIKRYLTAISFEVIYCLLYESKFESLFDWTFFQKFNMMHYILAIFLILIDRLVQLGLILMYRRWSRGEEKNGKSIRQLGAHQPPSTTTNTVVLVDIFAERGFFGPKLYDNDKGEGKNPNFCRNCGFSTSATMSSPYHRAASPAVDYANYCSLPRRKTTNNKTTINIGVGSSADFRNCTVEADHENPSDFLKLLKKTSIQSKMGGENFNRRVYYANEADKNDDADQFSSWRDHRMQQHLYKKAQRVYEMSCDLLQKQLEIWCKRYGGYERARHAAIVIQKAYRKYALERNFERVCSKRRSGVQNLRVETIPSSSTTVKNCHQTKSLQNVFGTAINNNNNNKYSNIKRDTEVNFCSTFPTNDSIFPCGTPATKQESSTMMMDNRYVSYVRISSENCSSPHIFCGSDMQMSSHTTPENDVDSIGRKQMQFDIICSINYENGNVVAKSPVNNVLDGKIGYPSPTTTEFNNCSMAATTNTTTVIVDDFNVQDTTNYSNFYESQEDNALKMPAAAKSLQSPRRESLARLLTAALSPRQIRKKSNPEVGCVAAMTATMPSHSNLAGTSVEFSSSAKNADRSRSLTTTTATNYAPSTSGVGDQCGGRRATADKRQETLRRRQYRMALNFFNKKPDRGVEFLIGWGFVENSPSAVAKFLVSRKGLSRQMIGEYLGNLQKPFNQQVLRYFAEEVDMKNFEIDVALRKFQAKFRLPGEAQKIERIVEVFANRYCQCNPDFTSRFKQKDTVFVLAFAIIMLNTDLHSPNVKASRRMKVEDFVKNLRGIDADSDIDTKLLTDIYHRVKQSEFRSDADHVTQVLRVEQCLVGKKPTLALPHRRLVCFCRVSEVIDPLKKQSQNVHQREVFLFNDTLLITKLFARRKSTSTYNFRESHCLVGAQVCPFKNQYYSYGVEVNFTLENKKLYFNAKSDDDRIKLIEDLRESIFETDEMEALRIELELQRQTGLARPVEHLLQDRMAKHSVDTFPVAQGRRNSDRNSASYDVDVTQIHRHSSATSLDSGMSSASLGSRESFQHAHNNSLAKINEQKTTSDDEKSQATVSNV